MAQMDPMQTTDFWLGGHMGLHVCLRKFLMMWLIMLPQDLKFCLGIPEQTAKSKPLKP